MFGITNIIIFRFSTVSKFSHNDLQFSVDVFSRFLALQKHSDRCFILSWNWQLANILIICCSRVKYFSFSKSRIVPNLKWLFCCKTITWRSRNYWRSWAETNQEIEFFKISIEEYIWLWRCYPSGWESRGQQFHDLYFILMEQKGHFR